jgi:cytochrome c
MFRRLLSSLAAAALIAFAAQPAAADPKSDTVALLNEAITHFQKVGADQAFKDFADPKAGFIRGALYVVVIADAPDMKMVAHATNPKLNGMPQADMKDATGKQFNKEMYDKVKANGEAWIDYKWANPETKKIGMKHSLYKKVGSYLIGSGYYD